MAMPYTITVFLILMSCQVAVQNIDNLAAQNRAKVDLNKSKVITRNENRKCGVFQKNPNSIQKLMYCSDDSTCPPWFQCRNNECKCGPNHQHMICCDDELQQSAVLDCYCMTHDEKTGETVAGACFYNCENNTNSGIDTIYHRTTNSTSNLNTIMCGHLNRTGPLCGKCKSETYPLAYSYNLTCVYCPDGHKNWWKFIFAAFLPLTLFYLFVLFFKVNATSSHLHSFVLYSQIITTSAFVRIVLRAVEMNPSMLTVAKVALTFYGIWNLDFFRTVLPNICLQTSTLQTLALDYVIAVYPLFLMIISYVFIELHDRNFRVIVFLWKPFRFVLTLFRRKWDSRTSVIDAYATFFLLSSMKFLSVSFDLLAPARLYKLNSTQSSLVLYYDGSIAYFGKEHLPYAILAIVILSIFIIIPIIILLMYPLRLFQKLLNSFPIRWHILHTFVDSFQGCFKDGTEPGTFDCRWFSAIFLIWRLLGYVTYAVTLQSTFLETGVLLYLLLAVLIVTVQPFKARVAHFNRINTTFTLLIAMFCAAIAGMDVASIKGQRFYNFYATLSTVSGIIPLVYITCIVIYWIFSHRKWGLEFIQRIRAWRQGYNLWELQQSFEDSLPDRIVHPADYHEGNLASFKSVSLSNQLTNGTY